MTDRERKEIERLKAQEVIEPEATTDCAHYRCLQPAGACFKRQTTTRRSRNQGAVDHPQDPYCASGACEVGNLIAEKISEKVEGLKIRAGGMTFTRTDRPKVPKRDAVRCKGEGCSRLLRSDNERGVCAPCSRKAPYRKSRAGMKPWKEG